MDIMARVEVSERALKVLKIEAAMAGISQKEALEALILRGVSSRTLAVMAGKPLVDKELLMADMPEMNKEAKSPSMNKEPALTNEARQALTYILQELEAGREPTSREAAERVGLTPTGLGMALSKLGIKAQNTRRDMQAVKIYTRPMKAKIEEILGKN